MSRSEVGSAAGPMGSSGNTSPGSAGSQLDIGLLLGQRRREALNRGYERVGNGPTLLQTCLNHIKESY